MSPSPSPTTFILPPTRKKVRFNDVHVHVLMRIAAVDADEPWVWDIRYTKPDYFGNTWAP